MIFVVTGGRSVRQEANIRFLEILLMVLLLTFDDALQTVMPLVVDYFGMTGFRVLVGEITEILPNNTLLPIVENHVEEGYGLVQVVF